MYVTTLSAYSGIFTVGFFAIFTAGLLTYFAMFIAGSVCSRVILAYFAMFTVGLLAYFAML